MGLPLAIIIGGAIRSVAGWLENAFKDGRITKFEVGKLISTILRIGMITAGFYFGLGLESLQSIGAGLLTDFGLLAIKKAGKNE